MRELILIGIVLVLCPLSLVNPRWGLYAYTWFALMRPDELAWSAGHHQYSLALAVCTLLGSIPYFARLEIWVRSFFCWMFFLLTLCFGVTVYTAIDDHGAAWVQYQLFLRVILMAMLIPVLVQTEKHFREMFLVVTFSIGFLGWKWGTGGLLGGGAHYRGGAGGFLGDNNCVALAFAMVVPLCWYARQLVKPTWAKLTYLAMFVGSIAGIVWTHSRGGALSVAVVLVMIAMRSKFKLGVLVLLIAMSAVPLYLVRESYGKRIATLENPVEEESARGRLEFWQAAFAMWQDHPVLGVGFGSASFQILLSQYLGRTDTHVAHNTYVQVLVDSGAIALLLYVTLMFATIIWLGFSARKWKRLKPGMQLYPWALQSALVAFMIGSTFLTRVNFDFYYILVMLAASWHIVQKQLKLNVPSEIQATPAASQYRWAGYQQPSLAPAGGRNVG